VSDSAAPERFIEPRGSRGLAAEEQHPLARTVEEWREVFVGWGEQKFRADQVFRWIHQRAVLDSERMTDLSKALRQRLSSAGVMEPGEVVDVHCSLDGTRKLLLQMRDRAKVECVIIPMTKGPSAQLISGVDDEDEDGARKRVTLCISTQFGCAMGCKFCASGQSGLFRGLGAAEVVYQVLRSRKYLDPDEDLRNLVFMGMGEPLHHYDETARAIRLLTHPMGANMSPRRITVSTVGLVPGIRRLGEDFAGKVGLAVSLHAPDDATRDRIMPMNKKYPIADLMRALSQYPLPPRRRITIEYILIGGQNDSLEHAEQLARLLRPLRVKINLIPMNPIEQSELSAPRDEDVVSFRERLVKRGYSCFVRTRRGDDVSAACGQLALRSQSPVKLTRRGQPADSLVEMGKGSD
jgi:23S rRNA (adenine2503-C2)-methyltransferase